MVGSSTRTNFIIDNSGKAAIGASAGAVINTSYALTVNGALLSAQGGFDIAASGPASANKGKFAYTDSTGNLNYTTTGSGTQNNITFNNAGNVGIGTTSPFATLSVQGNGFFDGNLTGANLTATGTLNVTGNTTLANATSTNFAITNISSGFLLKTATGGAVVPAIAGTDYLVPGSVSGYPFYAAGNATTTLTQFNGGLTAYASTTIGSGTAQGGLTVSGNSTTTGTAYFAGSLGIGTSTPINTLQVVGGNIGIDSGKAIQINGGTGSSLYINDSNGTVMRALNFQSSWSDNTLSSFFQMGQGSAIFSGSTGTVLNRFGITSSGTEISDAAYNTLPAPAGLLDVYSATPGHILVVKNTGLVGIGTSSPFATLSVNGNGFITGTFTTANINATGTLAVAGNTTLAQATSTTFAITNISSGFLLKTATGGAIVPAVAGTDYLTSANASPYPFYAAGECDDDSHAVQRRSHGVRFLHHRQRHRGRRPHH